MAAADVTGDCPPRGSERHGRTAGERSGETLSNDRWGAVSFGILTVIVLAGLVGPLFSSSERVLIPVVVGELVAGLVVGKSGFGWVDPGDATTAFMASIGFAM